MTVASVTAARKRPIAWGPIAYFFCFLNLSLLVFAYGPWPWPIADPETFYGFLIACHVMLLVGYLNGARQPIGGNRWKVDPEKLLFISVVVNLVLLVPTMLVRTDGNLNPLAALSDPAAAYAQVQASAGTEASVGVMVTRMFLGPISILLLPMTVMFWERLRPIVKFLAILSIFLNTSSWILVGTNKGIGDLVIQLPWLLIARARSGKMKITKGHVAAITTCVAALVVLFVYFFTSTQSARGGIAEVPERFANTDIYVDNNAPLYTITPDPLKPSFRGLTAYLSNGYYGLNLCMQLPYVPTYGAGNSIFLSIVEQRLIGSDYLAEQSYPARAENAYGWLRLNFWHSFYAWWASDITFPGVIGLMFIVGWLFALSWSDTVKTENPFASSMMIQFVILITYLGANNQTVQVAEGFSSFYVLLVFWLVTRRPERAAA